MYTYNTNLIKQDSELKFYLLGLIGSDGYISAKSNSIELQLNSRDKKLLENLRDVIVPGKKISYKQSTDSSLLKLDNKEIHVEVSKYIEPGAKSHSFRMPTGIPDEYFSHFLRGYSDGDGNISVKKGQRKFNAHTKYYFGLRFRILGTKSFLLSVSDTLYRLGITSNRVTPHRKDKIFYIEYGFKMAEKVLNFIYKDCLFKLDRKFNVFQEIKTMDSKELEQKYGTPEGCYNTRDRRNSEDIVGASRKLEEIT